MAQVVIPYFTGAGHTLRLAQAILDGLQSGGATGILQDVRLLADQPVDAPDWQVLHDADAIVLGAPTFMGSVAAGFKAFMDASSDFWCDQHWQDKLAAGFTVGSSPSGDKSNTLATLSVFAAQHGMIWVGQAEIGPPSNPKNVGINEQGFCLGLGATSSRDKSQLIDAGDLETARRFGLRIAKVTQRWAG